jgi:hypothetical protein
MIMNSKYSKDLANLQKDASWYVTTLAVPNAMFMHINVA